MIERLQRKFGFIALGSLLLVMVVVLGAVNTVNFHQINERADGLLRILSDNGGKFPASSDKDKPPEDGPPGAQMNEETQFETRYFTARASSGGTVTQIDTGHVAAISSAEAKEMAEQALSSGRDSGTIGVYRYLRTEQNDGSLLVFVDCRNQFETAKSFLIASFEIGLASLAVVGLLVAVLSRKAIRPVVESIQKQKRFIADAGHEIKTPLSIISANTDVLELQQGKSEWTDSIRRQVMRLGGLVENMLALSRLEEGGRRLSSVPVPLSALAAEEAEPFRTLAAAQGCRLETDIGPDITVKGEPGSLRQLIGILLDNAVKYAGGGKTIRLNLRKNGKSGAVLEVYNDLDAPPQGDLSRLFDRFYRADDSRERRTGGYGIGLSIAAATAAAHRATLCAEARGCGIVFTLVLK